MKLFHISANVKFVFLFLSIYALFQATLLSGCSSSNTSEYAFPEGQLSIGEDMSGWMYVGEGVDIRSFSHVDSPVVKTVSHRLVNVLASVYYEQHWILIYCPEPDSSYGSAGWVQASDLSENIDYKAITYPVKIKDDAAVDSVSGKPFDFPQWEVWVDKYESDMAVVIWEGGNMVRVSKDDLLLPYIINGELVFE